MPGKITYSSDLLWRVVDEIAHVVDAGCRNAAMYALMALSDAGNHLVDIRGARGIETHVVELAAEAVCEALPNLEEVRTRLWEDVETMH